MKKLLSILLLLSLQTNANNFDTLCTQAEKSRERNDFHEAIKLYEQVLKLKPQDIQSNFFLGYSYQTIGNLEKAVEQYKTTLTLVPENPSVQTNLAHALRHLGRPEEAVECYESALAQKETNASLHYGFGETLLKLGDFDRGWHEFEWRLQRDESWKSLEPKMWNGSDLTGKRVAIRGEYGLGDTLQFVRFARHLKESGAYIIAHVQGALLKLLSMCPYIDEVAPLNKSIEYDFHIPVMSLAYKLGVTDEEQFAQDIPYLSADKAIVDYWKSELERDGNFKIGLCWEGSTYYDSLRPVQSKKAMHLSEFAPLAELPNVTLYSLQKSNASKHVDEVSFEVRTIDGLDEEHGRFMDTAALIENFDCIVTVDTSVAHLAGAMGKTVFMILPTIADWRWMLERNDSPWYPTMKLFRQTEYGNWKNVMHAIADDLEKMIAQKTKKADTVLAEISVGELIDKITILQLKSKHITDEKKLKNVCKELEILQTTRNRHVPQSEEIDCLAQELYNVNAQLWNIEDDCRDKERDKEFDDEFVQVTRSVYMTNDKRCALKRKLNLLCGSNLIEEKSYAAY